MKNIFSLISLLLLSLISSSQENLKVQLYYNYDWEITDKSNAAYTRDTEYDINNINLNGFVTDRNRLGNIVMEGTYSKNKKNGDFKFYYKSGAVESKGKYDNNERSGDWEYYYPDGKLKQKISYFMKDGNKDFAVMEYFDRNGNQLIKNGTGKWVNDSIRSGFNEASLKTLTGEFENGLKTGKWELKRLSDNKFMYSEKFRKGRFIEATAHDSKRNLNMDLTVELLTKNPDTYSFKFGNTENLKLDKKYYQSIIDSDMVTIFKTVTGKEFTVKNRELTYPGGDIALLKFIAGKLKYPILSMVNKEQGTVYIVVTVDSLGKNKNVELLKGVSKGLNEESLRVVSMIQNWFPKIIDGKAVESKVTIPVKFAMKGN